MKRKMRKFLLTLSAALLLVSMSVGVTVAYLTDSEVVKNTFTVGQVHIKLDEAAVDENGKALKDEPRVTAEEGKEKGNQYHLLPNGEYDKDPTVTVLKGSEASYVRAFVTVSNSKELDELFDKYNKNDADDDDLNVESFIGSDNKDWVLADVTEDTAADTRTYELRYYQKVPANTAENATDTKLKPIFTTIKVPGQLTGDDMKVLAKVTIRVEAQAIQADGFANADAAWLAWK